jgi:hypothetical protein
VKKHISFSELKNWDTCPYYHKLTYLDKIKAFQGNEFTAFGNAIHETCEHILLLDKPSKDPSNYFAHKFMSRIEDLKTKNLDLDKKLLTDMFEQGKTLSKIVLPSLKDFFGDYEVVATEQELYEKIEIDLDIDDIYFKGYIDLVIKTSDGKYHVIDWKSCSWGWDARRKADKMTTYQLTFYKHYYASKFNVDPDDIQTYFALLKRTAKKNKVEIFRVSSGNKKTQNALNLLKKSLYNISKENFIKNRLSCKRCEFYKTEHCQ